MRFLNKRGPPPQRGCRLDGLLQRLLTFGANLAVCLVGGHCVLDAEHPQFPSGQ